MQAPQRLVAPPVTGWWAEVPLVEVALPAGVVELVGPVPVVEAVGNVTVIMPAGVVELVGPVPVVSGGALVDAPAGVVELVGPVPAVEVATSIAIPPGMLDLVGPVPGWGDEITVIMPAGVVELVGPVPVVSGGALVDAPAGVVELVGPVPAVEAATSIAIPPGMLELVAVAPRLYESAEVAVPAGVVELVGLVPVVSGGARVDAPAGVVELVGPVPGVEVVNPDPVAIAGNYGDGEIKKDGAKTPSWGHYIRTESASASLAVVHLLVASTSGYSAVGSTTASWQGTAMSLAYSEVISCQYGTALTYLVFSLADPSLPSPLSNATVSASISLSGTVYSIGYSTLFEHANGIELSDKLVRDWPTGGSTDSSLLTGPAYPSVVDPLSCYQTTQVTDRTTHLYRSVGDGKSASNSPAGAMLVYTATGPEFADGKVTPFYDPLDRSFVAGTYRNDGFGTYIFRITPKP